MFFFFFFQAEDGIRDYKVTGVQTCALPISKPDGPGVSRSRFRKSRVSRVMVDEPLWAKDARAAGGGRCPPRRRSRGSAEGRRGLEWRTGASAGRESPRPGESRTGASTGRPARTQSYRATARSAYACTRPPAATHGDGGRAPGPRPRPPRRAPDPACEIGRAHV